jgi:hypothetical protein
MKKRNKLLISTIAASLLVSQPLLSDTDVTDSNTTADQKAGSKDIVYVPYVFSTDSTGFAGGIGVIKQGFLQPQTTAIATLFYGAEQDIITNNQSDTANFSGGFAAIFDYRIPGTDRLLFSALGMKAYFPKARYYVYDHSNDSKEESYTESSGDADFMYATLRYVLPMGDGLDNPEGHYILKNGFAVNREGYGGGKPFITGRTGLGISAFYEHNTFDNWLPGSPRSTDGMKDWNTNGLRFFVDHDNTDYDLNPSRGYQFKLQYSKDFGWGDSEQTWDFLEFKYNHYIDMPTFSFTQQNVLAMSFWTGNSFSWDRNSEHSPDITSHRPPPWEGGKLGGMFRMRGYNTDRFSDKAVIYGTAEYRAILDWNPFRKNEYIPVAVDWLQVVGFVEAGRVNDTYNFDLLSDMKFDAGISLRAMAAQVPVRVDLAYGDEGANFWVMVFQPFDF